MTTSTVSGNKDRTTKTVSLFQNRMGQIYTVRTYSTYSIRLHCLLYNFIANFMLHCFSAMQLLVQWLFCIIIIMI